MSSGSSHIANVRREPLFDLSGRVALVTGGGSGIGLMATQALAANGARVYITGRTKEKLDRVVETYGKDVAGSIIPVQGDVTSKDHIRRIVSEVGSREKCLCILVNNAGISSTHLDLDSLSDDPHSLRENLFETDGSDFADWTSPYATNVAAQYFTTTAFLPLLHRSSELHKAKGWTATVINISSISGMIKHSQRHFSYNASKSAAIHLNRMLATEIAHSALDIRINSIAPGVFPSEMTTSSSGDDQKSPEVDDKKIAGKVPAGRAGRDSDMAQTVLFFAANQYLNGQTLAIDGGYTLTVGQ